MKLSKFTELCESKWADGRGDVQTLYLRENSFSELYEDIITNRAGPVSIVHPHWDLVNPATKSVVSVKTFDEDRDVAVVHYGGWKQSEKVDVDGLQCA
jgi:hypothetical protein